MESRKARVSGLFRFPIRGCRGEAVDMLHFDEWGPIHDRRWMIVDEKGSVVTQHEIPTLACLKATKLSGNQLGLVWYGGRIPESFLTTYHVSYPSVDVKVCGQTYPTFMAYETVHPWLSDRLGRPVRLVRIKRDLDRTQNTRDPRSGFANGSHVLITTEASHKSLLQQFPRPLPLDRFRPTIVLRGIPSLREDGWIGRRIWIGGVVFTITRPHACGTTVNIDQHTGTCDSKLLSTLTEIRGTQDGVHFGVHGEHHKRGAIRIHDPVRLLRPTRH